MSQPSPTETAGGAPIREHSHEEIDERLTRAREAQVHWRAYSLSQRVAQLRGFWKFLCKDRERLIGVIHSETGKPRAEIEGMEIDGVELILKFFTRGAHRALKDRPARRPWIMFNKRAYERFVPRGVIGLITPWNMPFLIPLGDAIGALLAGNAVVIKPSEWTSKTALYLEERFAASGLFPEGLLQVCVGGAAAGGRVLDGVDMVLFTGSTETGRKVSAAAAARLIPAVLELGGKHPMLVAADAPLERAVKAALWGRFANSGQICVGVERVLAVGEIYDAFCAALEADLKTLRQNKGAGFETDLGRLIFPGQLSVVERHLADARDKGGRVVGGAVRDRAGLVIEPAVVFDATPDMLCMKEETFGPLLAVSKIGSVDDAIRELNREHFGLAASVWTQDLRQGEKWCATLEAGMVSLNDLLSHYIVCSLPFGGVKRSGLGRRHSDEGLRMFCSRQAVIIHEFPARSPELWWFPYSKMKSRIVSWLVRLS